MHFHTYITWNSTYITHTSHEFPQIHYMNFYTYITWISTYITHTHVNFLYLEECFTHTVHDFPVATHTSACLMNESCMTHVRRIRNETCLRWCPWLNLMTHIWIIYDEFEMRRVWDDARDSNDACMTHVWLIRNETLYHCINKMYRVAKTHRIP